MKKRWKILIGLVAFFAILIVGWFLWQRGHVGPATVSKETTFVTEFVREDGYIDYVQAVQAQRNPELPPDENAFVMLLECFGPRGVSYDEDAKLFSSLWTASKTDRPIPHGPFFIGWELFSPNDVEDLAGQKAGEPWHENDYPKLLEWLEVNQGALQRASVASKLEYLVFPPLVDDSEKWVFELSLYYQGVYRELAVAFCVRAMNHLQQGRVDQCQDDLLTVQRLACLTAGKQPFLNEMTGAFRMLFFAHASEFRMLGEPGLTKLQLERYEIRIANLPDLPKTGLSVDRMERVMILDLIQALHQGKHVFGDIEPNGSIITNRMPKDSFDLNIAFRNINQLFDELVAALELKVYRDRITQTESIVERHEYPFGESSFFENSLKQFQFHAGRKSRAVILSRQVAALMVQPAAMFESSVTSLAVQRKLARLAIKIRLHRLANGTFPANLNQLKNVDRELMYDDFSNTTLVYKTTANGFILYSVGRNMQDDGGVSDDSPREGDIVFKYEEK